MGKKLSAAQKQQISATLKRKWAEKKELQAANDAKAQYRADMVNFKDVVRKNAELLAPTPRSSKDEAMQLAVDVIDIVTPHLKSLSTETLVTLVDRILRP